MGYRERRYQRRHALTGQHQYNTRSARCQEKTARGIKPPDRLPATSPLVPCVGHEHSRSAIARNRAASRHAPPQEPIPEGPTGFFPFCRSVCVSPYCGAAFWPRWFVGGCKTPNSILNGWPPLQSGSHRTDPPQLSGEKCLTRYLANRFPLFCRGAHTRTNEVPSLLWRSLRDLNSRRVSPDLGLAIRPLTGSGKAAYSSFQSDYRRCSVRGVIP